MGTTVITPCFLCGESDSRALIDLESVPVTCNALLETREVAQSMARARIDLVWCERCGLIYNRAFDPALVDYSSTYENALQGSPSFRRYAEALADRLVTEHVPEGGSVLELGCGDGYFLRLLRRSGAASGVGIDPSYRGPTLDDGLVFVTDHFDAEVTAGRFDLVCARHLLEHVPGPRALLESLHPRLSRGGVVYAEVPDGRWTLVQLGIWDLIYEHCTYFTPPALRYLAAASGFAVRALRSEFGGQFLGLDLAGGQSGHETGSEELEQLAAAALEFPTRAVTLIHAWRAWMAGASTERPLALWGAGSKGVTFLNLCDRGRTVRTVVDVNPKKQGRFVPGTAQEIVPPEALADGRAWTVLITNPLYKEEIAQMLHGMGTRAELVSAAGPPPDQANRR